MNAKKESGAQAMNEQTEVMTFNFSESKSEIRNVFINGQPHFIGSDIAKALGYKNTTDAIKQHCRYVVKSYIPHPQSKTKQLQVLVIPEGDLYRLIINSTLPSAQKFESWVMDEVLPTIRKKGIYAMNSNRHNDDFIDARTIPFAKVLINEVLVRMIVIDEVEYYSINDYHNAINSRTGANQTAKKLNALEKLAVKIWLYGNTHPAWFTKIRGLELIASGSRIMKPSNQIMLPL
ncbi:BRO family protein [Flavobacterium sp.]|uniref:BRO-N domain-containing protein n=1 Tax=Flavobacterium sp. TaxID=239 RepID=UPI00261803B4|nr:BRO family protein [Flavobacterium sp.]